MSCGAVEWGKHGAATDIFLRRCSGKEELATGLTQGRMGLHRRMHLASVRVGRAQWGQGEAGPDMQ